jgi:hypothetical protein
VSGHLHEWADVLAVCARLLPADERERFVDVMAEVAECCPGGPVPTDDLELQARRIVVIYRRHCGDEVGS